MIKINGDHFQWLNGIFLQKFTCGRGYEEYRLPSPSPPHHANTRTPYPRKTPHRARTALIQL
jgi:hypothetical protein